MARSLTPAQLGTIDAAILDARGNGDVHDPDAALLHDTVAAAPVIEAWMAGKVRDLPMALTRAILAARDLDDDERDDCAGITIEAADAAAEAVYSMA